ncbi:MAG: alpha/beta fold hydrolase [Pseudomonadota bacterium]
MTQKAGTPAFFPIRGAGSPRRAPCRAPAPARLAVVLALLAMLATLAACAGVPATAERRLHADTLAAQRRWQPDVIAAGGFALLAYLPPRPPAEATLTVYIEGDGLAWLSGDMPSPDPTPLAPVALAMALAQPRGAAAYLSRPCQYLPTQAPCQRALWTNRRLAPEVVTAMDAAMSTLKARFGASRLVLVGYSGGGAIAALVAARRDDVARLVTVAGNLDTDAWTRWHRVTPLDGSLNPASAWAALATTPQLHWIGELDQVVPAAIAQAYAARFPAAARPALRLVPGYGHTCCWARDWATLWEQSQPD